MAGCALITFLGRGQLDGRSGYRSARYRFPDGTLRESSFFGLALLEHVAPDRLVVLGTPGSMWDVLIEHLAGGRGGEREEQRLALIEAAEARAVDEAQLEALRPLAEQAVGRPCELVLVDYGRDLDGQIDLLDRLAETVAGQRAVHFDITHGLRHLAMLSLVACHFLEALIRGLSVEQIWYGALELREPAGEVPVLELEGLSHLQRWVQALDHFERTGEYGSLADLLEADGLAPDKANLLRRAAHFEGVLNLPEARRQLRGFLDVLEGEPLPGAARLFGERLRQRIRWVRGEDLYAQQSRLARLHLGKGDYLRAAILANEAVLTRWMTERGFGEVNQQRDRQQARTELLAEMRAARRDAAASDFSMLEALRNALAHGSVPRWRRTRDLLRHPDRLAAELERILAALVP